MGELVVGADRNAGTPPARLDAQALGQRAVVEIFAVPATPPRQRGQKDAAGEHQQEHVDQIILGRQVRVERKGDTHQRGQGVDQAHRQHHALAKMHREPVGDMEQPVDGDRGAGGHAMR